ncbi:MAG: serine/threonine protein kinase, partial [Planctomycetales bacterium]
MSQSTPTKADLFTRFTLQRPWLPTLLVAAGFTLAGVWAYWSLENSLRSSLKVQLETLLEADVEALKIWLETQQETVRRSANEEEVKRLAAELIQLAQDDQADSAALRDSDALRRLRAELDGLCPRNDFCGFLITNPQGRVLASRKDDALEKPTPVSLREDVEKVFQGRMAVCRPFRLLNSDDGSETVVLAFSAPVTGPDGDVIAALSFGVLPDQRFTRILSVARFGETGETYAFDETGRMISKSRFEDELVEFGLLKKGTSSVLNVSLRDPGGDMRIGYRPRKSREELRLTKMAASAVQGEQSADVKGYRDYRGVLVVGAWRWLPDHGFGVATEVDLEEAYAALNPMRTVFFAVTGLLVASSLLIFPFCAAAGRLRRQLRDASDEARRLGQYTLQEMIGSGGMGEVYRATHALMRRPTAIKLLNAETTDDHALARFEREVQLTCRLTHPNTVAMYDYGRTPEGVFYYAMEYLDGLPLDDLIGKEGPISPGRVIHLLRQICGSLREAHANNMIHRDVKAANVMLCRRGGVPDVVKVLDFGLAKDTTPSDD